MTCCCLRRHGERRQAWRSTSSSPITLCGAVVVFIRVASPRSPIFTMPSEPLMKMLSPWRQERVQCFWLGLMPS